MIKKNFLLYFVFFLLPFTVSCATVRTEFYRGEAKHLYDQAKASYESGDYNTAKEHLTHITDYDPSCAQAWAGLGHIAYLEDDMDSAQACYHKAVEINPQLETTLQHLATVVAFQKRQQAATQKPCNLHQMSGILASADSAAFDRMVSTCNNLSAIAADSSTLSQESLNHFSGDMLNKLFNDGTPPESVLFCAYFLLYHTEDKKEEAIGYIQKTASRVDDNHRQEAFMVIGKYYQSHGEANKALLYFKAALAAGAPMKAVAPQIAEIFRIPAEAAIGQKTSIEP